MYSEGKTIGGGEGMHTRNGWVLALVISMVFLFSTTFLAGCATSSQLDRSSSQNNSGTGNKVSNGNEIFLEGTKVDDLDLSGTALTEASQKINAWAKNKLEETRVLMYNKTEIPVTLKEMGVDLDNQKTIDRIQRTPGNAQPSALKLDSSQISKELRDKLRQLNQPPKDATYKIENDKFVITPEVKGLSVDLDQTISDFSDTSLSDMPSRINIKMIEIPATITTESVQSLAFDTVIGEFSTKFAVAEENRSANLVEATKALNNKVIRPGEIFSFNETVGPREPSTGYKDAYVIINGEYVQGTGGGVCQVSSTLYNAVLLSNLSIVERMPHAVVVSYVPAGQDATVNYPTIDFKFKNDSTALLYIKTEVMSGLLTIKIWGKKTDKSVRIERQVETEIEFKTEKRLDPKLPVGRVVQDQTGTKGLVVNTWKIVRDASGNENKQFLGRDSYAPTNRILRVGS